MHELVEKIHFFIVKLKFIISEILNTGTVSTGSVILTSWPVIGSIISLVTTFLLYKFGTKKIATFAEVSKFHEKYINIKNEIWFQKSNILIHGIYNSDYLEQYLKINLKLLNLLFEEILCSKHNKDLKNKLKKSNLDDSWIRSTCFDVYSNLKLLDSCMENTQKNLIGSKESLEKRFSDRIKIIHVEEIDGDESDYLANLYFKVFNNSIYNEKNLEKQFFGSNLVNEIQMALVESFKPHIEIANQINKSNQRNKTIVQLVV